MHSFLTSEPDGGEWTASHPIRHRLPVDWKLVDPTTDLDVLEKRKIVPAFQESKQDCTVVQPIAVSVPTELFWLRYPTV